MDLESANALADLLQRAPLAGFLSLTLLVVAFLFGLLMREKSAHQDTIREVVKLTQAMSQQWNQQLEMQQEAAQFDQALRVVLERVVEKLDSRKRTTTNPGGFPAVSANPNAPLPSTASLSLDPISTPGARLSPEVLKAIRKKQSDE